MIYFYFGLGIAMLAGITGLFELATTITKQQIYTQTTNINNNELLQKKQNDRRFLQLLNETLESLGEGNNLCSNIKDGMTNIDNENFTILSNYSDLIDYEAGIPLTSMHTDLLNGCDLNNGKHRLIIVPSNQDSINYKLYSCLTVSSKCKFEEE